MKNKEEKRPFHRDLAKKLKDSNRWVCVWKEDEGISAEMSDPNAILDLFEIILCDDRLAADFDGYRSARAFAVIEENEIN